MHIHEGVRYKCARGIFAGAIMSLLPSLSYGKTEVDSSHYLFGDWGGVRTMLSEQGVNLRLGYFSQTAYNAKGGESSEVAYADQYFLGGYVDLHKLVDWPGATFSIEITNRNGTLINQEADMPFLLQSQQIFGRGNVTRLTQFSLTQHLLNDTLRIKAGRIYPSADFFAMSCAFQHLTFCSGGSSNYISSSWYGDPLSALGVQVTYSLTPELDLKIGSYDANPATLSLGQGLKLGTSSGQRGTTAVAEIAYRTTGFKGLPGEYRVGMLRSSLDKQKQVNETGYPVYTDPSATPMLDTEYAYYINMEQQVTDNNQGGGLRWFVSLIQSDDEVSAVGGVIALGGYYRGLLTSRPHDRIGLAIGRNSVSGLLTAAQKRYLAKGIDESAFVQEHEYPIELNYNYVVSEAVEIMPSLQYVINPNGNNQASDALIVGLQVSLNF